MEMNIKRIHYLYYNTQNFIHYKSRAWALGKHFPVTATATAGPDRTNTPNTERVAAMHLTATSSTKFKSVYTRKASART